MRLERTEVFKDLGTCSDKCFTSPTSLTLILSPEQPKNIGSKQVARTPQTQSRMKLLAALALASSAV